MVNALNIAALAPGAPAPFPKTQRTSLRQNEVGSTFSALDSQGKPLTWGSYKDMGPNNPSRAVQVKVNGQTYQGTMFWVDNRQYPSETNFATVRVANKDERTFQTIDIAPGGKVSQITDRPGVER